MQQDVDVLLKTGFITGYVHRYRKLRITKTDKTLGDVYPEVKTLMKDFPYYISEPENRIMFFTHEGAKEVFLRIGLGQYQSEKRGIFTGINLQVAREFVGVPPKAIELYDNYARGHITLPVEIFYYGIAFRCTPDSLYELLDWLYDNKPVPKEVVDIGFKKAIRFGTREILPFEEKYPDMDKVEELIEKASTGSNIFTLHDEMNAASRAKFERMKAQEKDKGESK